jgi:hypothetical protein
VRNDSCSEHQIDPFRSAIRSFISQHPNRCNIEVRFIIICIYSEIEFIKPLDDVKIQRKTITFTKDECSRTVFINKKINSGIMRMFIFFYNFYIYIFYFVSQVLCIYTDNSGYFSMRNIHFFYL